MADKTGGILARIGTPAGASIAADIAAISIAPPIISLSGTCDGDMGASTTTIDCVELAGYGDDFFNNKYWMQVVLNANSVGAAPEIEYRLITNYVSATGVFTCNAFSANVEANDKIVILHESLPFMKYTEYLTGSGNYTVPAGVKEIDVLLVAGGGAGGSSSSAYSGGGGGGEIVLASNIAVYPGLVISYVIGAGGTPGAAGDNNGGSGGNTTFGTIIAYGGLYGSKGTVHTGGNGGQTTVTGGTGGAADTAGSNGTQASTALILKCGGGGGGGGSAGGTGRAGGGSLFASGGTYVAAGGSGGGGSYGVGATGGAAGAGGVAASANSGGGGSGTGGGGNLAGGAGGSGYIRISWR